MKAKTFLNKFRLENFKAIQKSGGVKFTPLTVFIGNNGSGKSSLVEGLETYRSIIIDGLDTAMQRWFGMDHIWSKRVRHKVIGLGLANETCENPILFSVSGRTAQGTFRASMRVNAEPGRNAFFIQEESVEAPAGCEWVRDRGGTCFTKKGDEKEKLRQRFEPGESVMPRDLRDVIGKWQFLSLLPDPMGRPTVKKMAGNGAMVLNRDGSNLAQYLLNIRTKDMAAFDGIVEAMRFVLDYARNVEPVETREIQPTMYLKMLEQLRDESIEIPGWLISTGTIRILALLAVLRNPDPPPLVVVEEIENGLDPRTIHMVLDEIRTAVQDGQSQVILTTHSPYLLDLLPLQTLVLVERENGGNPVFWRPSDSEEIQEWAKRFAPGQLYTTGRFKREARS